MAASHSVEELRHQIRDLDLEAESFLRDDPYVKIMEQLKEDVWKILEDHHFPGDVIEFTRAPNKPEKDRGDHRRRLIRIIQICHPLKDHWNCHEQYKPKCPVQISILFVGMNPSQSAESGIPFPDRDAMRNYWEILVGGCESGNRFWNLIEKLYGEIGRDRKHFLDHCFVINCTPLYFVGDVKPEAYRYPPVENGNISLDNFIDSDLNQDHYVMQLLKKSDEALTDAINLLSPMLIIPIGWYAWNKVKGLTINQDIAIGNYIPHPSPKNMEEQKWMKKAMRILTKNGVYEVLRKSNREQDERLSIEQRWSDWKVVATRPHGDEMSGEYEPMPDYKKGWRATYTAMREWWAGFDNGLYELRVDGADKVYLGIRSPRDKLQSLIGKVYAHTRSESPTFETLVSCLEKGEQIFARVLPCEELDEPEVVFMWMIQDKNYPWHRIQEE